MKFRSVLLLLLVTALLAACQLMPIGRKEPTPSPKKPTSVFFDDQLGILKKNVKARMALLVPLSGENAALGKAIYNAVQLSFYAKPHDFLLLPFDTQSQPAHARQAAQEAIARGAQIILGPLTSLETEAVADVTLQAHVPVLSFSNNQSIAKPGVWVLGILPQDQIRRLCSYVAAQGMQRIGVILPTTFYGQVIERALQEAAGNYHLKVVAKIYYDPQAQDYRSSLASLKKHDDIEALLIPVGGSELSVITSTLAYLDIKLKTLQLLGTSEWTNSSTNTTELTKNTWVHGAWIAELAQERFQTFSDAYRVRYGQIPAVIAGLGYEACSLAMQVLSYGDVVAKLTDENGFIGLYGLFRLTSQGLNERVLPIKKVTAGGLQIIQSAPTHFGE